MFVVLQPAGNAAARRNYQATVERPVPLSTLASFLPDPVIAGLRRTAGQAGIPTWGIVPGTGNERSWARLGPGDIVLFVAGSRIKATAVLTAKARDAALARRLWGEQDDGMTWELLYFMAEVTGRDIPLAEVQAVAGYSQSFPIRGFNVLDAEKSARVLAAFELDASAIDADSRPAEAPSEVTAQGELDREVLRIERTEQQKLKRTLLGGRSAADCALCGRRMPAALLIGAHVKKRAFCTDSERRDLANVAVLMCRMGCDDLFEKGYLGVGPDGVVAVSPLLHRTPAVHQLLAIVDGRKLPVFRTSNAGYFAWHFGRVFKAPPAPL